MHRLDSLRRLPFLDALDNDEIRHVAAACEERQYAPNEVIVEEGATSVGLFVVGAGVASVLKAVRWRRQQAIAKLHAGDHFGEMSLINNAPISATVIADGKVECLFFPRASFMRVLDEHPAIGRKVLWSFAQTLSHRLVEADRRYARALYVRDRGAAVVHLTSLVVLYSRIVWAYSRVFLRWKLGIPYRPERLSRIHRRSAQLFRDVACRLKGANVKMAQLASLQAHLLPTEVIEELRTLRDQVTATEYPLIAGMIQSEFGLGPLEIFADFDKVPIAAASMGQVHEARLVTGERVVVKVLHPGLERSVRIDLWVIRSVFKVLARFLKKVDLMQLYREAEEPLHEELNLLLEAKATEQIGRELQRMGVRVPRVYWHHSTQRVLTLEYLNGVKLSDIEQIKSWGIDRRKLMQSYMDAFLRQALEGGYFHCDPHPANAFCMPDGQLALLDFGMVKKLPAIVRTGLMKEILGAFFNNPTLYADGVIERGVVGERERVLLESFAREVFADPQMRSAIFDHDIKGTGDVKNLSGKMGELLKKLDTFRTPQNELMFVRALGITIDVCREVYPEEAVSQLVMPVAIPIFRRFLTENPQYAQLPPGELADAWTRIRELLEMARSSLRVQRTRLERDVTGMFQTALQRLLVFSQTDRRTWPE